MAETANAAAPPVPQPPPNGHARTEYEVFDEHEGPRTIGIRNDANVVTEYLIYPFGPGDIKRWTEIYEQNIKVDETGKITERNPEGLMHGLIGLLLHDKSGKPVPESVFAAWTHRTKNAVYMRCRAVGGLDDTVPAGKY